MNAIEPKDEAYTLAQAGKALGVSPVTLRRWIHAGQIDAFQVNPLAQRPSYRIRRGDVEARREKGRYVPR